MEFGVNGLGKSGANAKAGAKSVPATPEVVAASPNAPEMPNAAPSADALALGEAPEFPPASSRQLARECAEKLTRLNAAAGDPAAYEQVADAIGTPGYVVVDTVNRLCRDTQAEPIEDRVRALNMIQHLVALPDDMRGAIEEDLRRTGQAG